MPGRVVTRNHVLIGCLGPAQNDEAAARGQTQLQDLSVVPRQASEGVARVERVMLQTLDRYTKRAVVVIAEYRCPVPGDKFSSLFGQKGVAARLTRPEDMPFRADGSMPGFVMGQHGFHSRKTMNQLKSTTAGVVAAYAGRPVDLTSFGSTTIDDLRGYLRQTGRRDVVTPMFNGARGTRFTNEVFMGIETMGRLKQQLRDKRSSRQRGAPNPVTLQPPQGRNRGGGMKIGRMEVDGILGHGAEATLRIDRHYLNSDRLDAVVCAKCGRFADPNASTMLRRTGPRRAAFCRPCGTDAHLVNVRSFFSLRRVQAMLEGGLMSMRLQVDTDDTVDEDATAAPFVAKHCPVRKGDGKKAL